MSQIETKTFKEWYWSLPADQQKKTFLELCEFLGKSPIHIKRHWINGDKLPSPGDRLAIEKFTGGVVSFLIHEAA